jgi:hypothetical protein
MLLCVVSVDTIFMGSSSARRNYIKVRKQEQEINELKDSNVKLESYITLKNCIPGKFFSTEHYSCSACPENFYRTIHNTSCIHCPEGFFSKKGDEMCVKSPSNTTNIHTLCPKGKVVGNDKFATLGSCVRCNPEKKEYMHYMSNNDKCLECPIGSVVNAYASTCTPCPVGYYEQNNTCFECPIGTYSDSIGMSSCNICNNDKSFAYITTGGYNCDDSYFHSIGEIVNINIFDVDDFLTPIAEKTLQITAKIYNNRKVLYAASPLLATVLVFGSFFSL